jgi:D-3-phosphoglycerate dehydrogenase
VTHKFLVVIADSPFETCEKEQAILHGIGAEVQKFNCRNESEVIEAARDAHVVLCDTSPITRDVISNLRRAIGIVEYGIGYDNIDVDAAIEKGIVVCNVPDFITSEVADHAVAMILALARKLHHAIYSTRAGEWDWRKLRPIDNLDGRIAGIIGFGNIGRQVAKRLQVFQMNILAYDPYIPSETIEKLGAKPANLEELLSNSDVVSIHVPLTKETCHLIGKNELAMMKSSAILVNTSRGAVIDQEALIESLVNRKIRAAGLDVLKREPPDPSDPVLKLDNVIVTPHIGWYSEQSALRLQEYAAFEAERILRGQMPKHPINPEVLAKRRVLDAT